MDGVNSSNGLSILAKVVLGYLFFASILLICILIWQPKIDFPKIDPFVPVSSVPPDNSKDAQGLVKTGRENFAKAKTIFSKTNQTPQEQKEGMSYLQASITGFQLATQLDSKNPDTWLNLAGVHYYVYISNGDQGAKRFAIEYYKKSLNLMNDFDPQRSGVVDQLERLKEK